MQLESGADTELRGAVVQAPQIQAQVGGDLLVQSLQDRSEWHDNSNQSGGTVGYGSSMNGSISTSATKIDSAYTSVVEQSGLRAGDGGFQVTVQGHTDLQGGILSSSEQAIERDANRLTTGTLSHSDLHNSATLSAESSGISISSDMVIDPETNRPVLRKLSEAEKHNLKPGPDGKVHIADNGIFNDAQAAGGYGPIRIL